VQQIRIIHHLCDQFLFVSQGKVARFPDWETFVEQPEVRQYLGATLDNYEALK
jgi:hypothetical protein